MPRTPSSTESLESVLKRSPSANLTTPATNKAVPIRPMKRLRGKEDSDVEEEDPGSPPPVDLGEAGEKKVLEPRMLRFEDDPEQAKEDAEEAVRVTQPWPEQEEGELPVRMPPFSPLLKPCSLSSRVSGIRPCRKPRGRRDGSVKRKSYQTRGWLKGRVDSTFLNVHPSYTREEALNMPSQVMFSDDFFGADGY